jgi:hypothetical protein
MRHARAVSILKRSYRPKFLRYYRPKTSEATARGNIVSTDCFLDVLALASVRDSVGSKAMVQDGMVTTLPKMGPAATGLFHHNPLLSHILTILSLPKTMFSAKLVIGTSTRSCPR